ncbi:MAG TPA: DUF6498-containing protein [Rhodanobacteraceae bacterium]|jgi:hypothetical protein|nr:DUF6498-containing protein [Rhodanobacteraceae bacterium]
MDPSIPADAPADNAPRTGARLRGILIVLLVNAVPIIGVLRFDWSAINVLVLYWFENVVIAVFTCVRIAVHRSLTRKRGYWRGGQVGIQVNGKTVQSGLLGEYAIMAFTFTFGHGIFVGAIALIFSQNHPDQPMWQLSLAQVGRGVLAITVMLGLELIGDLITIRWRTFAWMRGYVEARMGRVIVLHLAIIFGMMAMAATDSPLGILYVLIGLKTLADLGGVIGQTATPNANAKPPAWSLKIVDKLSKNKGDAEDFAKKWETDQALARRNAIEDEEVMPVPPH